MPVALCGAMASDPLAAVLLVGLGLRELSMEAAAIPEIKESIRRVAVTECRRIAETALSLDTADAVEELIAGTFAPVLFDLLTGNAEETVPFEQDADGGVRRPCGRSPIWSRGAPTSRQRCAEISDRPASRRCRCRGRERAPRR